MSISKRNFPFNTTIFTLIILVSMVSVSLCLEDMDRPSGYKNLYLLPLSFLICVATFFFSIISNKKITQNIPNILVIILLFIRNTLTPIVMVWDSYKSSLGIPNSQNVENAIGLITYETVSLFLFLYLRKTIFIRKIRFVRKINRESYGVFKIVFVGMLLICITALILIPEFRTQFYSIFTKDITHLIQEEANYNVGTILRVLATLGDICIGAMRIILPTYIIYKIALKGQTVKTLILALFCVFMQCLLMNDSNAYILMLMISQFLLVYKLFPKYHKMIIIGLLVFSMAFLIILYINRFMLDHYGASMSLFLQSYLPSVANTAGIFNIKPKHNFWQMFIDIFVAIPFKTTLGYTGNATSINTIWQETNGCKGQIMPTIAGSYYYFGSILSPFLSCLFISIANKANEKLNGEDNVMLYAVYIYLMIYSAATPFIYNGCIYIQCFLQRMIFMFIVAIFSPLHFSDIEHLKIKGEE